MHNYYRIRQLNWVSGKNLECRINETSSEVRELVYTSITGLLYDNKKSLVNDSTPNRNPMNFRSIECRFGQSTSRETFMYSSLL